MPICSGCRKDIPRDGFHKHSYAKSGLDCYCKSCRALYQKERARKESRKFPWGWVFRQIWKCDRKFRGHGINDYYASFLHVCEMVRDENLEYAEDEAAKIVRGIKKTLAESRIGTRSKSGRELNHMTNKVKGTPENTIKLYEKRLDLIKEHGYNINKLADVEKIDQLLERNGL